MMKKKLITLLVALVAALSLQAQTMTLSELRQTVALIQTQLPIQVGSFLTMTDMQLTDKGLLYAYDIADVGGTLRDVEESDWQEQTRGQLPSMLADTHVRLPLECIASNNLTFTMRYHGTVSGVTRSLEFTTSELRAALRGVGATTPQQQLANQIALTQRSLPLALATGMTQTDYSLVGNTVTAELTCDASKVSLRQIKTMQQQLKTKLETALVNEPITRYTLDLCVKAGYGYAYVYKSTDPGITPLRISWTAAQLRALLE